MMESAWRADIHLPHGTPGYSTNAAGVHHFFVEPTEMLPAGEHRGRGCLVGLNQSRHRATLE